MVECVEGSVHPDSFRVAARCARCAVRSLEFHMASSARSCRLRRGWILPSCPLRLPDHLDLLDLSLCSITVGAFFIAARTNNGDSCQIPASDPGRPTDHSNPPCQRRRVKTKARSVSTKQIDLPGHTVASRPCRANCIDQKCSVSTGVDAETRRRRWIQLKPTVRTRSCSKLPMQPSCRAGHCVAHLTAGTWPAELPCRGTVYFFSEIVST
ncbi:hypothetical protein V8E55_001665 [Tylopilus felleus]